MIRPFTFIALVAAGAAGLNLYSVKRDAQLEEQNTAKTWRDAKEVRTHAGLLHAEYDLLSDPDRLHELANQVLKLQPTDPKQYVSLADLTKRLPAIAPLPAPPEPPKVDPPKVEAPKADLVAEKPPEKPVEKIADKVDPKPVADKPVQVASTPKPAPAAAAAQPAPQPAQIAAVAPKPVVVAKPAPSVVAEARPLPSVPPATPVQTHQSTPHHVPAVAETPAPMPFTGSALGMARIRAKFVPSDSGADR